MENTSHCQALGGILRAEYVLDSTLEKFNVSIKYLPSRTYLMEKIDEVIYGPWNKHVDYFQTIFLF